jgi:hypothetical protein
MSPERSVTYVSERTLCCRFSWTFEATVAGTRIYTMLHSGGGEQADGYAKEFGPSLEVSISARVFESYAFAVESALRCWWLIC